MKKNVATPPISTSPSYGHSRLTLAQIILLRQAATNAASRRVVDRIVRESFLLRNRATNKRKSDFATD